MRILFHVPHEFVKIYVALTPALHLRSPFLSSEGEWIDTTQQAIARQPSLEVEPITIMHVSIVKMSSVFTPRATLYCHGRAVRMYQLPKVLWEVHFF